MMDDDLDDAAGLVLGVAPLVEDHRRLQRLVPPTRLPRLDQAQ